MVRNLIRNQAPGNRLRVRIPCPPLKKPVISLAYFLFADEFTGRGFCRSHASLGKVGPFLELTPRVAKLVKSFGHPEKSPKVLTTFATSQTMSFALKTHGVCSRRIRHLRRHYGFSSTQTSQRFTIPSSGSSTTPTGRNPHLISVRSEAMFSCFVCARTTFISFTFIAYSLSALADSVANPRFQNPSSIPYAISTTPSLSGAPLKPQEPTSVRSSSKRIRNMHVQGSGAVEFFTRSSHSGEISERTLGGRLSTHASTS